MFTSQKQETERIKAVTGMLAAIAGAAAVASQGKAASAERMEALALTVAALGFSPESIESVEIDWRKIYVNGVFELVPVLRMTSVDGSINEINHKGEAQL